MGKIGGAAQPQTAIGLSRWITMLGLKQVMDAWLGLVFIKLAIWAGAFEVAVERG